MNRPSGCNELNHSSEEWRTTAHAHLEECLRAFNSTHFWVSSELENWQASVGVWLAFDPVLQAKFRESAMILVDAGANRALDYKNGEPSRIHRARVKAYLEQGIHELRQPPPRVDHRATIAAPPPLLTEDQSLQWFVMHCNWKVKIHLALAALALLSAGFFAGKNDFLRKVYDAWTNQPVMQPQNTNIDPSATKIETNLKTISPTDTKD